MDRKRIDQTQRFSSRVQTYVRARPSYPREALVWMLEGCAERFTLLAADLGAGTGISSRLLADFVGEVLAVEPNEHMREAMRAHPRVRSINGSAEATTLAEGSIGLVTFFQSLHWCEPSATIFEVARILALGGRFAAVWNERDERDPFTAAYGQAILEVADRSVMTLGARAWKAEFSEELQRRGFGELFHATFRNAQRLNLENLLERAKSASYVPLEGAPWAHLEHRLLTLHKESADAQGEVTLRYRTSVHRSDLATKATEQPMRRRAADRE